jgi:hypothetical protein
MVNLQNKSMFSVDGKVLGKPGELIPGYGLVEMTRDELDKLGDKVFEKFMIVEETFDPSMPESPKQTKKAKEQLTQTKSEAQ